MIKQIHFILLFFVFASCFAQQHDYIIGKLYDAKTQEPVAFASIRIKDRALGVISNTDGSFKIPIRYKEYGDIIEISSMGYQSLQVLIDGFKIDSINELLLEPAAMQLQEAIVSEKRRRKRLISAKNIVRKAVKAIPDNYSSRPFSIIGYYRDYQIKDKDSSYLNLNEAILEVFDPGITKPDLANTKVSLYNYKPNLEFERDQQAEKKYNYQNWNKVIDKAYLYNYGGNEFTILRVHDAIRNYNVNSYDFINRMETDLFNNHYFYKEDDVYTEDEALYQIRIMQRKFGHIVHGTFYISKKDFAIHKMEYAIYDRSKTNSSGSINKYGNNNELIFEVTTEYVREYSKMYLNYISFRNSFQLEMPADFVVVQTTAHLPNRCFEVRFNKKVDKATGEAKKNYNFTFKDKKLKFKKIEVFDDRARLYPDMPEHELTNMLVDFATAVKNEIDLSTILKVEFGDINSYSVDPLYAYVLNERSYAYYQQFREFFVQQIKPNSNGPIDGSFMDMSKPIFKDQPIVKPDNFDDYWMNTPLQSIKN